MLAIRSISPLCRAFAALLSAGVALSAIGGPALGGETAELSTSSTSKHNVDGARSGLPCRPQDEMWVVSTRGVGCLKSGETPALGFAVRDAHGAWHESTLEAFVAATAGSQARFWIHGYGVTPEEAVDVGGVAHEQFVASDEPPLKFVVWSWPSEREGYRRVKDIREKGCRAQVEAYCLAWLITRMSGDADVSMIGYSYGTRIIAGGLHLVGGGELCGGLSLNLPAVVLASDVGRDGAVLAAPSRNCRAVMLAAAMGSDWLVEGGFNERALGQTSEMLSIFSSTDRVLKFYPLATKEKHDHALGYRGLATMPVRDDGNGKFAELDVDYMIGTDHGLETYLEHVEIAAAARHALAAKAVSAESEPTPEAK